MNVLLRVHAICVYGRCQVAVSTVYIGVLLLVGLTGIQLDFKLVRRRGATAAKIGIAGFVIPLGFGIATGYLLPASLLANNVDVTVFAMAGRPLPWGRV
ncbi:hypothetical protein [Streptosporangium sp. 'caverna']|uniref:hypothetical protein n=1 Tax=Streptosporangium sp. 'caverna' TaxID=2202249 RepID=UPI0013A6D0BD|nr:hypothetical protein [Streptosporangium sp. 'caverna']